MIEQLQEIEEKYENFELQMSDPEIINNRSLYSELLKKHAELKDTVEKFKAYKNILNQISEAKELLIDPDMNEIAQLEISELKTKELLLREQLEYALIPKDPDDTKNALVEIRQGTGGDEAALFAADLYRMYLKFAENNNWKTEILSQNISEIGGIKEVVFSVSGISVYASLKYESGTHRVQRVPSTEASGRIHTSAATVAVLPEAEDVDIEIEQKDLRIDTYRASGAGGQHVNKTSSAVRITHLPTGTVVACQDERSQFQNKDKAMRMLRTKLYEVEQERKRSSEASMRKQQVGSGDRSEKIRTYNFPQGRVTDHRINLTLYCLEDILNGNKLQQIIEGLQKAEYLEKIKAS